MTPPRSERPRPEASEGKGRIVDPTSDLLRQITGVESRIPWIPLGIAILFLLWLPGLWPLTTEPMRPHETAWVQQVLSEYGGDSSGSKFSRVLSEATWTWQGAEIESADLTPPQRLAARLPAMGASLAGLIVFYFLARMIVGQAAALLAGCLLAIAAPWVRGATSAMPLLVGEVFVLFGVSWALTLQGRHREVQLAGVTATRIGIAGLFLGFGLLLAPAGVATFLTTLLVWLMLGLRRSSSGATTLPVGQPREIAFFAVAGTLFLAGATGLVAWGAERFLAGSPAGPSFLLPPSAPVDLWVDVYRRLLSPGPATDLLIVASIVVVGGVRSAEFFAGRPWQAAGLLPWAFLVAWVFTIRADLPVRLDVPMTLPALFVLGFGWMLLRGLRPGVIRRQEYTFLVTWVLMGALLVPVVGGEHAHAPVLASMVVLLPPMALVAGRGARALWESEDGLIARLSILVIAYAPILIYLTQAVIALASGDAFDPDVVMTSPLNLASTKVNQLLPTLVLCAAFLGILSELVTVRPDVVPAGEDSRRRRPVRRGRRPAGGGRRPGGNRRRGGRGRS